MTRRARNLLNSFGTRFYYDRTSWMRLGEIPENFSNIYMHISAHKPFAQITAWRYDKNVEENRERNIELINDLRSYGLGGTKLKGRYIPPGSSTPQDEISFFVPYNGNDVADFKRTIQHLLNLYNQDSALFSDGTNVYFLTASGGIDMRFSSVHFNGSDLKNGWSQLRGHTYQFLESGFANGNTLFKWGYHACGLQSDLSKQHNLLNEFFRPYRQYITLPGDEQ